MDSNYTDIKRYVEEYYRGTLEAGEKKQFEDKIISDPVFAEEVAFYLSAIAVTKEIRQEETRERFKGLYKQERPAKKTRSSGIISLSWVITSVAASLILAVGGYFLFFQTSPENLANNYVKENLMELDKTMGATDTLQQGIVMYNAHQYDSAIMLLKGFYISHPDNSEAKKNIGLAYLAQKNYDEALRQFDELENMHGLYADRALFYKAITLMERNDKGDKEKAKQLLQIVREQKLYGKEKAEEWEKKF